jgi:Tfp pilus assembly PilM family ATPase
MPRILAIDWDRHEARALLVSAGPTGMSVAGAWTASLATAEPDGLSGKQIGARLAAAMGGPVSGKVTALVAVGRDNVQMKLMSLPPAPADELPEMVRFQAEREFTALGADSALDFIPLAGDAESAHQVLAIALSPAGIKEVNELCEAIGVEPNRIPLRGCAAAALANRAGLIDSNRIALVVSPLTDEADLVVQSGDTVLLLRTVRLPDPTQGEARQRALVGEIRRTMAAVRQQSADHQVGQIIVCGENALANHGATLASELEVPVATFDPTAHAPVGLTSKGLSAESINRFAATLGMALDEANREQPSVDFANIRRRQEVRRFNRTHGLIAAAAGCVALLIAFLLYNRLAEPGRQLASVQQQTRDAQTQADGLKKITEQAAAIDRWLANDVVWLDELNEFAHRVRPEALSAKEFPVANDAVVTQIIMQRPAGMNSVGGRMDVQAVAKSPAAVAALESRLRDDTHTVTTGIGKLDKSVPGYDWSFGLDVRVPATEQTPPAPPKARTSGDVKPAPTNAANSTAEKAAAK